MKIRKKKINTDQTDVLIYSINSILDGNAINFNDDVIGDPILTNKLNELLNFFNNSCNSSTILAINSVLKENIQLSELRSMLICVMRQAEFIDYMGQGVKKLMTSIDDTVDLSNELNKTSTKSIQRSNDSLKTVLDFTNYLKHIINEFYAISDNVSTFENDLKKVNSIANSISDIADRISLLSLNASIEAARAGDSGKGFAVISSEIKKLSESAKNTVKDVKDNLGHLNITTTETFSLLNTTIDKFKNEQSDLDKVVIAIEEVNDCLNKTVDNIKIVTDSVEEQFNSTKEICNSIYEIKDQTNSIEAMCKKTAKDIFKLSQFTNKVRIDSINSNKTLSDREKIEIYKVDHLIWKWRIYNMLLGIFKVDINIAGDYRNCALGKWYYSILGDESDNKLKYDKNFIKIESLHINLHNLAKDAAIEYSKGDISLTEMNLNKMEEVSYEIVELLDKIKAIS